MKLIEFRGNLGFVISDATADPAGAGQAPTTFFRVAGNRK